MSSKSQATLFSRLLQELYSLPRARSAQRLLSASGVAMAVAVQAYLRGSPGLSLTSYDIAELPSGADKYCLRLTLQDVEGWAEGSLVVRRFSLKLAVEDEQDAG